MALTLDKVPQYSSHAAVEAAVTGFRDETDGAAHGPTPFACRLEADMLPIGARPPRRRRGRTGRLEPLDREASRHYPCDRRSSRRERRVGAGAGSGLEGAPKAAVSEGRVGRRRG